MKCKNCNYPFVPGSSKKCPNCGEDNTGFFEWLLQMLFNIAFIGAIIVGVKMCF
jgi:hypothetical protein